MIIARSSSRCMCEGVAKILVVQMHSRLGQQRPWCQKEDRPPWEQQLSEEAYAICTVSKDFPKENGKLVTSIIISTLKFNIRTRHKCTRLWQSWSRIRLRTLRRFLNALIASCLVTKTSHFSPYARRSDSPHGKPSASCGCGNNCRACGNNRGGNADATNNWCGNQQSVRLRCKHC